MGGVDSRGRQGRPEGLSPARAWDFLTLGFTGPRTALTEVREGEKVHTALGALSARHVWARVRRGSRALEYHAWLTADVPFGWARMEVRETFDQAGPRTVFTATIARSGRQARSELGERKAGD
jgi:hypothetical protein